MSTITSASAAKDWGTLKECLSAWPPEGTDRIYLVRLAAPANCRERRDLRPIPYDYRSARDTMEVVFLAWTFAACPNLSRWIFKDQIR